MEIKILGPGCKNCDNLERNTKEALTALGTEAQIDKVTEFPDIMAYGIMSTPGLVVDGQVVVSGRVPDAKEIQGMLAEAE